MRAVVLTTEMRGDALVITVGTSKLGYEEIDSFGERLTEIVAARAGRDLVLNLSQVRFLATVVIGKIFKIRKAIQEAGGHLKVVASDTSVLQVFRACQLDRIMEIHSTLEEAIPSRPETSSP
jgi:anti-sigma B factor antagonist